MKKVIIFIASMLIFLVGCSSQSKISQDNTNLESQQMESNETVENDNNIDESQTEIIIEDEYFVTELNKIFLNINSYVGKSIKIEGILSNIVENKFSVVRFYDMDHGDHKDEILVGIDGRYKGELPKDESWIEIEGKIELQLVNGEEKPIVNVSKLTTKDSYGKKKVVN